MEQDTIIPLWLRDVYGKVNSSPIYEMQGALNLDKGSEYQANELYDAEQLFLKGDDLFAYIKDHPDVIKQNVTIVIKGLTNLFWERRKLLPEEIQNLSNAINQPAPDFKNVAEYQSLRNIDSPLYQLFGNITPYNMLYIPVRDFVNSINQNIPIQVKINGLGIIISLHYRDYDFWDPKTQMLRKY